MTHSMTYEIERGMTGQATSVQAHHCTMFFAQKANVSLQSSAKGLFSLAVSLQTLQEVARPHGRKVKESTSTVSKPSLPSIQSMALSFHVDF